jgi:tetratricopeptide (TPR) repeat protein
LSTISPSRERSAAHRRFAADALLVALALVAYLPVLRADFVWDDFFLIVNNTNMEGLAGLVRTWIEPASVRYPWYPLTTTTFWIEHALFGLDPLFYHLDNVLLHAADAVLLFRLASALGIPGAWLAGALFAVHPIHVESVAWIVERKNVLAGLFLLLGLHAFVRAADLRDLLTPSDAPRPWNDRWVLAALAAFALAMLAKTAVAPAPGALLVLLWLKQGRVTPRDLARVAPFFAVAGALAGITVAMENVVVGENQDFIQLPALARVLLFARIAWFYVGKHLLPLDLMFFYPRWQVDAHDAWQWLPLVAALGLLALCFALRGRWGRGPLAAALVYGGMLLPASSFFNVLFMFYSFVQNHFVYFASLPVVLVLGALLQRAIAALPSRPLRVVAVAVVLAPLCALTFAEARTFEREEVLWRASIERNPRAWMALTNLAGILIERGDYKTAEQHLRAAIAVNPVDYWAHNNLGIAMARQGRFAEAVPHYEAAIEAMRENPVAWTNLGLALAKLGKGAAAERAWRTALAIDPTYPAARQALAHWQRGGLP